MHIISKAEGTEKTHPYIRSRVTEAYYVLILCFNVAAIVPTSDDVAVLNSTVRPYDTVII
jgi:hypothetical protein